MVTYIVLYTSCEKYMFFTFSFRMATEKKRKKGGRVGLQVEPWSKKKKTEEGAVELEYKGMYTIFNCIP